MATDELETVLANWVEQALSPCGRLPDGVSPSAWVAARFAEWWRQRASCTMADAERAASSAHQELTRLGDWESFGEALHELAHLRDSLDELRGLMGLADEADA
jgi:hypothetical protein